MLNVKQDVLIEELDKLILELAYYTGQDDWVAANKVNNRFDRLHSILTKRERRIVSLIKKWKAGKCGRFI